MTENAHDTVESFAIPEGMVVYYLRVLKRGLLWTPEETPEVARLQAAHIAYGGQLLASGKLILNGPLIDNGDLRGVGVFRVGSLEEARALSDADPSVRAGRLISEIHPWMIFNRLKTVRTHSLHIPPLTWEEIEAVLPRARVTAYAFPR